MPKIKCEECDGTGFIEVEDPKLSLLDMFEPFVNEDAIGFKLKHGADIPQLPSLEEQEMFPEVIARINNIE